MRKLKKIENKQVFGGKRPVITENSGFDDWDGGGLTPPTPPKKGPYKQPIQNPIRRWPPVITD